MTHRKREGGLKILSGKDFKAGHIVPGNVYRLGKRKFWLSLAYSVATRHAYQNYTKRVKIKAPFWRRAGQEAKGVQLCPLQSVSQQKKMNSVPAPQGTLIPQPHKDYQKGTNARVNQRGQSMRSILSLQFLGPYLSYTSHFADAKEDSAPPWRC